MSFFPARIFAYRIQRLKLSDSDLEISADQKTADLPDT
ncbi:Uncharacterized protein dnm_052280 [Desulfonema magnum]|uniref:Uncharacterized protein n=1 Tax=Desulfonema magnum TaxID=45655 RepID=A0A975BPW2_9BACT|nr:Uncharacterized protein dnm_052280 [Desulfonema magnum]